MPLQMALANAQKLGFAEADPSFDINGWDAAHKALILAMLAYGTPLSPDKIHVHGIEKVESVDIAMAEKLESYGKYVINGEEYARKKGNPDGILEKWYNRKRIDIECRRPIDDLAYSPALRQEISQSFDELMPFFLHFQKLCDREIANQNA